MIRSHRLAVIPGVKVPGVKVPCVKVHRVKVLGVNGLGRFRSVRCPHNRDRRKNKIHDLLITGHDHP